MKNGLELYKRIGRRETLAQRWNDLPDDERSKFEKLGQGVEAMAKLHNADAHKLALYLFQYVDIKQRRQ